MMDTDTSVMQERIGQLCHQFKLPTMGAQSVARFTAAVSISASFDPVDRKMTKVIDPVFHGH